MAQLLKRKTGDQRVAGSSLIASGVAALCPRARHFIRCLVQPRKSRPDITEKLLTGT